MNGIVIFMGQEIEIPTATSTVLRTVDGVTYVNMVERVRLKPTAKCVKLLVDLGAWITDPEVD